MKTDFIYEKVNAIVIEGLTEKGLSWFKPWRGQDGNLTQNMNYVTRRNYNGINTFILNSAGMANGYETGEWLTFNQIKGIEGAKLNKGEKSTMIVFWSVYFMDRAKKKYYPTEKALNAAGLTVNMPNVEKMFSLKYFNVFNIAQCVGIESKVEKVEPTTAKVNSPIEKAEEMVKGYQNAPQIKHVNKSQAYYSPSADFINMPDRNDFIDSDSYYKVLFHEMTHSTGHAKRLNRNTLVDMVKFGDLNYSREELVAEIGAMYMVGLTDISPKDDLKNSKAYINGWVKYLKEHEKEALTAMGQAAKAVDHIVGKA